MGYLRISQICSLLCLLNYTNKLVVIVECFNIQCIHHCDSMLYMLTCFSKVALQVEAFHMVSELDLKTGTSKMLVTMLKELIS